MLQARPADRPRVVIAGAGVAGVEAALALDAFMDGAARVTVVDASGRFAVPATAAGRAFGITPAVDVPVSRLLAGTGVALRPARLVAIDPGRRLAMLAGGELLGYEHLVIAVGGRTAAPLGEALTFRGHRDAHALRGLIDGVADHAERGAHTDLVVSIPRGCGWPLAGYDIALMAREHLVAQGHGERCRLSVVTAEEAPLAMFGPGAAASVAAALGRAGVEIVPDTEVVAFAWGSLTTSDGRVLAADRVVALPVMHGPRIEGLPMDGEGFVRCDAEGRVEGAPGVRIVGDAGTFPVMEGGIASGQADAVAADIARAHGIAVSAAGFPRWDGAAAAGHGAPAARWPVPKVTGRFLAPFLRDLVAGPAARRRIPAG
jgi:sulfide:quinone oxidoreductase